MTGEMSGGSTLKHVLPILDGIKHCENSDVRKNGYGIMCWNGKPRHLCVITEEEARDEVKARL